MANPVRLAAIPLLLVLFLTGCPPTTSVPATKPGSIDRAAIADVRWKTYAARRQTLFVKLDIPVIAGKTRISIGEPYLPSTSTDFASATSASADTMPGVPATIAPPSIWHGGEVRPFSTRIVRGAVEGPLVDQFTGQPRTSADNGSFLVPLPEIGPGTFEVREPFPIVMQVTVPPTADPGDYRFPITIAAPGKGGEELTLSVEVADIALPTDPRVLGVATVTTSDLARIYPATFGAIPANYLDRGDPEHKAAIDQLDALVKAARAQGMSLFVEDMTPATRVDGLGIVTVDWDAYDRVMQPYMDGSAFEDRVPLPVWLAPVPPRRIRDSSTQLWQYIDACAKHFTAKGWVGMPAFLHPALANSAAENAAELESAFAEKPDVAALKALVADMVRLHMPREMLAVASPGSPVPHSTMWSVNDDDPRLPPAGGLGNEFSIRAWPWACVARDGTHGGNPAMGGGVKGFVWRSAVVGEKDLGGGARTADDGVGTTSRPLLVVTKAGDVVPTVRMMWLNAGLNDAALLGLLEQRADTNRTGLISEVLAAMVGRTGLAEEHRQNADATAAPGFLYAGWPADRSIWGQVTPMLQRLLLASDPGRSGTIKTDDPLYMAAKMWLARSHRPVARVAGYSFSIRSGSESDILDARMNLLAENPIDATAEIEMRFANLPGDFDLPPLPGAAADEVPIRRRTMTLAPSAAGMVTLPLAGHVRALMAAPPLDALEISERQGGATLRMPMQLPIYRIHALGETQSAPKLDGQTDDWALDTQTKVFGMMPVGLRYLSRPDLLGASLTADDKPAAVRWIYDKDFLYVLAVCPQESTSDERNTDWPVAPAGEGIRWWGSDGLQLLLSPMPPTTRPADAAAAPAGAYDRLVKIAFKPAGIVLVQTGQWSKEKQLTWRDGPPGAPANLKYGISIQRKEGRVTGYVVEAAIPRAWIDGPNNATVPGTRAPAWRANVLRHRAAELVSSSWAGPLVDDNDVGMMGALLGE